MPTGQVRFPFRTGALLAAFLVLDGAAARAANTGSAGAGSAFETMQPSLPLTFLIAKNGTASASGTGGVSAGGPTMIGEIRIFTGAFAPGGFLEADGQIVSIASAPELFAHIGNRYGGDGVTTFAVPDLRGRALCGTGSGAGLTPRALGAAFGVETVTLSVAQLPSHAHTLPGASTGATGSGQALPTVQPTFAVTPLICASGTNESLHEIRYFAGNFEPGAWWTCDGRSLSTSTYGSLAAWLGTTYGSGGAGTFRLPDLRGRVALEAGNGYSAGNAPGNESASISTAQLPAHSHTYSAGSTGSAGAGQPVSNLQPALTIRFAIALSGLTPDYEPWRNTSSTPMLGEIRAFAGNTPPNGWAWCDGQIIPISGNTVLFGLYGQTFGGNGSTTMALPDLRGRTPIGVGEGPGLTERERGSDTGTELLWLGAPELAAHSHAQPAPEIDVQGNGTSIADGDATPTAADFTRFPGTTPGTPSTRTFTVRNLGLGDLTLSGAPRVSVAGNPAFGVTTLPAAVVSPSGSSSFVVTFAPGGIGPASAALTIASEDPDEAAFDFAIAGDAISLAFRHPGEPPGSGTPLTVRKTTGDPSKIDLSWAPACGSGATGYAVYEGALGTYNTHALFGGFCGGSGTSFPARSPGSGDRYYLVSAVDDVANEEGSLGRTSAGTEIARPAVPCRPTADLLACN